VLDSNVLVAAFRSRRGASFRVLTLLWNGRFEVTLIHLMSIPLTNTAVNPARSTGVAVFVGDRAMSQLRLFWLAPIVGVMLGAVIYRAIGTEEV